VILAALAAQPEVMLPLVAYAYLVSGPVAWAWGRLRRRPHDPSMRHEEHQDLSATKDTKITKNL